MAIFGIMGNAGIQASSAGTSLRMMYQNIFNPNKKQKAVLDMIQDKYKVSVKDSSGNNKSMADIILEMASNIPDEVMPEVVGKLFRITAQPGANAALVSAMDIASEESGGDVNAATNLIKETNSFVDKISQGDSKNVLSALAALIKANRSAANGHISESIAEEKQNTIQGLWAQVTSTFTEGIVKSFEKRQGGLEEMLRNLRDYFAKPETVQMIQNLIDMIVEIGKVLAWFAKIWANLYNMAPGLIKYWVTIQMFLTQIGTLISPIVQLIGVFNRFGGAISKLAGVSIAGSSAIAKAGNVRKVLADRAVSGAAVGAATIGSSFAVAGGRHIYGNAAVRANRQLAANAILAGELALSGASRSDTLNTLNNGTRQHYAEVQRRAKRIYGIRRAGRAFSSAFNAVPTMATFVPMIGGIKSMFVGLLASLAKAFGFLLNPITLAVGAITGLGFTIYKLFQFVNGNTEKQILAQQEMAKHSAEATRAMVSNSQWYKEQLEKTKNKAQLLESTGKSQKELEYEDNTNRFHEEFKDIADLTKNSSYKGIDQQVLSWRERFENPLYRAAIGKDYDKFVGSGLTDNPQMQYTGGESDLGVSMYRWLFGAKDKARFVQNNEIQAALRVSGANHPAIKMANEQIGNLRQQFFAGSITEDEYRKKAYEIRDSIVNLHDPKLRSSSGMTIEQFGNISDPSIYKEYAQGQYNIITSFIEGEAGTIVGKLNAYKALRDGVDTYSDKWWSAISGVIGDYPIKWNAVSSDGKQAKDVELSLSMLPDGTIKYDGILQQVREKIENFNLSIQDFARMAAKVYKMMADAKLVPNTKEDALKWTQKQMQNIPIATGDATSFFHNYIDDESTFRKYGVSLEEYQKFATNPREKITVGGKVYSAAKEQEHIRETLSNSAVNQIFDGVSAFNNGNGPLRPEYVNNGTGNVNSNANGGTGNQNTPPPTPNPTDQNDYRSHYDNSSARPTQININIDKLAHFDRTTVAASAEERDLIAAMENKITDAVYRIFAEASNQAQSIIDLT